MNVSVSGWVFLVLTCVYLPYMAIRTAIRARRPGGTPTRWQHLMGVFVAQGMTVFVALVAAESDDVRLFPRPTITPSSVVAALGFLALSLGTLPMRWNWKPAPEKQRTMWLLPHSTRDLWWWALVALTAGVCEEIVFRGVMLTLWQRVLGSWPGAVAICATVFSVSHFVQGWRAMLVIGLLAVGFHVIVKMSGDLYTAMAIHFVYDLLAGFVLLSLAKRDGLAPVSISGSGSG
jgi:membrane protease YdiL (CAAX protease family)